MSAINVLILVDDNFEAEILKEYLEEYNFNTVRVTDNITDAIEVYHSSDIDFVIIDIFIHGKPKGITFAKMLLKDINNAPPFLFLTGHTERTIFEEAKITSPHGFVIKPFNEQELVYTIELILEKQNSVLERNKAQNNIITLPYFLKKNSIFHRVFPDDIFSVEVEGRYCKINTLKTNFISQHTLIDFQKKLPVSFIRVHRNFMVNTTKIKEVHPKDNLIVLENDQHVYLGRAYKNEFFNQYKAIQ